ncbi:MAG TPA: polyprenyl synthetase family protein [Pyrinomonadaceae bacterium]|jgi:geranylgeranyl diphosphate synthase type II
MTAPLQPHATQESLADYVARMRPPIEQALRRHLPSTSAQFETPYNEALEYALFPGGKRLRPVLTLLGAELVGGRAEEVFDAAAAVEFIHTSSLVFDDLPCMDDARARRGREPLHRLYGDGVAILVALGLLNAAYGIVANAAPSAPERARAAHAEIVECIGPRGMVAGQAIDLASDGARTAAAAPGEFDAARNLKTSSLMRLAVGLGAILCGADARQLAALARVAELLGNAYQIRDDLHDLHEDSATSASSHDADHALGRERIEAQVGEVKRVLASEFGDGPAARRLRELADFIANHRG